MDLIVGTTVLVLETTVHPTNMALQTLETTGGSPVTTALETTTIPLPRLGVTVPEVETMVVTPEVILAIMVLGLETMDLELTLGLEVTALDLVTTAREAMALKLETLAAMDQEVITIPLPRLEATAPKLETMAASLATMALDLATTVLEVTTMHLLRLAAMVQAPTLATMALGLEAMVLKLETTAAILAVTGTATAHRLVVEPVTVPTWQTNWTPG